MRQVETAVMAQPAEKVIVASELYRTFTPGMPVQTYYKSLSRLVQQGKLTHLTKGIYIRPRIGRFGAIPVSEEEIAARYLQPGQGMAVGYRLYNRKGLTTQVGKQLEILSCALQEEQKHIQHVVIRRVDLSLTPDAVAAIEALEILQHWSSIEDVNQPAMAACLHQYALSYSDSATKAVLARRKYKKATVAALSAVLDHYGIPHTLSGMLSPLSVYKLPPKEALYEPAS